MQEDNEYRDDEVVMEGAEEDEHEDRMPELAFWDRSEGFMNALNGWFYLPFIAFNTSQKPVRT
jgi:hypothetical protein